ncbi:MAG TPA: UDP-N-acetylmuramoyl-L-alanine--D-glutamate ligase [Patescibacteria group bacterium]|nr:UDP-N-acetylmuramoyl-L-alanine--D-glutamate ligase [Patescibacteria group bacterium]
MTDFKDKKIIILGFGEEGESVANFLLDRGAIVSAVDVRNKDKFDDEKIKKFESRGVKFRFDSYPDDFGGFDLAVRSPGISTESAVVKKISKRGIKVTSSTKIFFELCPCPIIGITGTKGKSTTSSLIYEMLRADGKDVYLGGNIGLPPLNFLKELKSDSYVVLELSSFQLQDLTQSPHVAVFLMVTGEHLDYHGGFKEYIDAKRNILRFQTPNDFAVVNRDYPASNESDVLSVGQIYYVSRERAVDNGCFVRDESIWVRIDDKENKVIDAKDVLLKGKHNLENVCAAVMAATIVGVGIKTMVGVLKGFRGLEHRLELVGTKRGITFYNDSLATVPEATIEAMETLGDDVETVILGGYDRGLDYSELGKYLSNSKVKTLILFPTTGEKIWAEISRLVPNEHMRPAKYDASSMREAVVIASEITGEGKICLMSPAASSFNMFKNYKDRGEQFKEEVNKLQ